MEAQTFATASAALPGAALRALDPRDGAAIDALSRVCPDTGLMQNSARYRIDAYRALQALRPETLGVVAELPGASGLAGKLLVSFSRRQLEGRPRRCALLHSLMVHPEQRRRQIAHRLIERGVEEGRAQADGALLSCIQHGNAGSFAAFRKHGFEDRGELEGCFVPMRRRPVELRGIAIRPATAEDLPAAASALNAMYEGDNLYVPQTAESLAQRLGDSPFDSPWRHHLIAVDAAGTPLAGVTVVELYRLRTIHVDRLPPWLSLANHVLGIVPRSREIRQLTTEMPWFAPGQEAAARCLWQAIRHRWRDRADTLVGFYDPRSPVARMHVSPPWLPRAKMTMLTCTPESMSPDRRIFPFL
jgi:GNAT superfamily N-acetyltransferase